jgi:hypothetical protein
LTPPAYRPGLCLAIDNNQGKEKSMSNLSEHDLRALCNSADVVTLHAIDNLIQILSEAKEYMRRANHNAVIGTLLMVNDHAEDLNAAMRLYKVARRNTP